MRHFNYVRPQSLQEASQLLSVHAGRAALLSGGTDLVVQMGKGMRSPEVVIDLKRVADLSDRIEETPSAVCVGALARLADLVADRAVGARFPALLEAARAIGSVQIRNRATLAGNICNASPAADTAAPLLVYGARVNLVGIAGRRTVAIEHFFLAPGKTALALGEIVESVDLPYPDAGAGSAFERLARRGAMDVASVSVACLLSQSGRVRLGFGAVGSTPILAEGEAADIWETVDECVQPVSDIRAGADYRRAMVLALGRRALKRARERVRRQV
ncbi:MAG: FAD binding domain-containing protein [Planctomycetota bacterium]|jgi:carbon-monoxide dehydrogenase medium subunit